MSVMAKTPDGIGSPQHLAQLNVTSFNSCASYEEQVQWMLAHDAAAIAHVRPQIEKEARAAAVEDVIAHNMKQADYDNAPIEFQFALDDCNNELRALARATAGFKCVPVCFVDALERIAKYPQTRADEYDAESYREMARKALAARLK